LRRLTRDEIEEITDLLVDEVAVRSAGHPDVGMCSECFYAGVETAVRGLHYATGGVMVPLLARIARVRARRRA